MRRLTRPFNLFIAEQTVKNHISNILGKLGVETRVEAVLYALRHNLASLDGPEEIVGNELSPGGGPGTKRKV